MGKRSKSKKQKQKEKQQALVEQEHIVFDVIALLRDEQTDTKPNLGKFLKGYVNEIRGLNGTGKIGFYPVLEYKISKIFVRFLDDHELIHDLHPAKPEDEFFFYYGTTEVELKPREKELVKTFFERLVQFGFVTLEPATV